MFHQFQYVLFDFELTISKEEICDNNETFVHIG